MYIRPQFYLILSESQFVKKSWALKRLESLPKFGDRTQITLELKKDPSQLYSQHLKVRLDRLFQKAISVSDAISKVEIATEDRMSVHTTEFIN